MCIRKITYQDPWIQKRHHGSRAVRTRCKRNPRRISHTTMMINNRNQCWYLWYSLCLAIKIWQTCIQILVTYTPRYVLIKLNANCGVFRRQVLRRNKSADFKVNSRFFKIVRVNSKHINQFQHCISRYRVNKTTPPHGVTYILF